MNKKFLIISLILMLFLALAEVGESSTRYIDPINGVDSGAGGIGAPWKTISYVNSTALDSDTLLFLSNSTNLGKLGATGKGWTLDIYGGKLPAIIRGTSLITGAWTSDGNGVYHKAVGANAEYATYGGGIWFDGEVLLKGVTYNADLPTLKAAMAPGSYSYDGTTNLYVWMYDGSAPAGHAIEITNQNQAWLLRNNSTARNIIFEGGRLTTINTLLDGSTGSHYSYLFERCLIKRGAVGIQNSNAYNDIMVNNCDVIQNISSGIICSTATATVALNSTGVFGNAIVAGVGLQGTAGTLSKKNCNIVGNGFGPTMNSSGVITDLGGNISKCPAVASPANSEVVITIDDIYFPDGSYNPAGHVLNRPAFAAALNAHGVGMTHFITDWSNIFNPPPNDPWTILSPIYANPLNEIGNHTWDHEWMGTLNDSFEGTEIIYGPFSVLRTGGVTASYSRTTKLFTTSLGASIDCTSITFTTLQTTLNGLGYTTATITQANGGIEQSISLLASCMETFTDQDITTAFKLPLHTSDVYDHEITDLNNAIVAKGLTAPIIHAWPLGSGSAAAVTALAARGLIGMRGTALSTANEIQALKTHFAVGWVPAQSFANFSLATDNQATAEAAADHIAAMASVYPMAYNLWGHSTADITVNNLGWLAGRLVKLGVKVKTFGASVQAQINSGYKSSNGLLLTNQIAYPKRFNRAASSADLFAGDKTVCPHGTLDIEGKNCWGDRGAPPIGAYANPRGAGD